MQPHSQGLSSYRPGGGKMRDTGNEVDCSIVEEIRHPSYQFVS